MIFLVNPLHTERTGVFREIAQGENTESNFPSLKSRVSTHLLQMRIMRICRFVYAYMRIYVAYIRICDRFLNAYKLFKIAYINRGNYTEKWGLETIFRSTKKPSLIFVSMRESDFFSYLFLNRFFPKITHLFRVFEKYCPMRRLRTFSFASL